MKIICFILILFLSNILLFGQNTTKWLYDLQSPEIAFESTYFMGSPTVDNTFIESYFDGAYLSDYLKKTTFNNLTPTNILGTYNNFKLSYTMPVLAGGSTVAYYFAAENKTIADLQFDESLFKMFFAGNAQFAGDTLYIKDNFMSLTNFTQLKGGLVKQFNTARFQHTFFGALSLNVGTINNNILIDNARFYTDAEGSLIDTDIDMVYQWVKNKSDSKLKVVNGLGTSLDFCYNFKCDKGNSLSIAFNDIGFVKWFKPYSNVIDKDTAFTFEGIEIKDILNIEASTDNLNKDSINTKITELTDNRSYTSLLPMTMRLYFHHEINKSIEIGAGMKHVFNTAHKPFYFVDAKFYIQPLFMISPTLSYGGYAGFNAGLDLGFSIRQYSCIFGSDYITPFYDNKNFRGKGYYFRIVKRISTGPKSFEGSDNVRISRKPRCPKYRGSIFNN